MKMQNAIIEVVTFDTSDVIATSGDYFFLTPTGMSDYSYIDYGALHTTDNKTIVPHDYTETYFMGFGFERGQYYHLVNHAEGNYVDDELASIAVELLGGEPSTGTEIQSYADIIYWFENYGTPAQ